MEIKMCKARHQTGSWVRGRAEVGQVEAPDMTFGVLLVILVLYQVGFLTLTLG